MVAISFVPRSMNLQKSQRAVGAVLYTLERLDEDIDATMPWKVYAVTVLPDLKGVTRANHARVSNADVADIWDAPYSNLDISMQEASDRCARSNGES